MRGKAAFVSSDSQDASVCSRLSFRHAGGRDAENGVLPMRIQRMANERRASIPEDMEVPAPLVKKLLEDGPALAS